MVTQFVCGLLYSVLSDCCLICVLYCVPVACFMFLVLVLFVFLFCMCCVFFNFVYCFSLRVQLSLLFVYKFIVHCHRVETLLQLMNIVYFIL
jgi:hypothetical protein